MVKYCPVATRKGLASSRSDHPYPELMGVGPCSTWTTNGPLRPGASNSRLSTLNPLYSLLWRDFHQIRRNGSSVQWKSLFLARRAQIGVSDNIIYETCMVGLFVCAGMARSFRLWPLLTSDLSFQSTPARPPFHISMNYPLCLFYTLMSTHPIPLVLSAWTTPNSTIHEESSDLFYQPDIRLKRSIVFYNTIFTQCGEPTTYSQVTWWLSAMRTCRRFFLWGTK